MRIKTERLELLPLTPNQLKLWIENISELERELDCTYKAEPMEGILQRCGFKKYASGETAWWRL